LACPFFSPTQRAYDLSFSHPTRLPLGASWRGVCNAPNHEQAVPADFELESCNLGYAKNCFRLPKSRDADAVRFGVSKQSPETVFVQFVLEAGHLPAGSGLLQYDHRRNAWLVMHPDPRIQRLAEAFLQSYLEKNPTPSVLSEPWKRTAI